MAEKYFLTTPIYYVNARPHIGHAYTTIVADVLARRHRLQGDETFFLTGTDEHGQKIERSALAAGIAPQEFADQVSQTFADLWKRMGMTNDAFIRTTEARHRRAVQRLFTKLQENGHIYLSSYTGQYCVSEEMFVEGPPGTIGPDGRATETVTEENYFFDLSKFQGPLLELIESGGLVIEPEARRNEVLSFLRGGLRDLSISRSSFTWGIPVPGDEKHVIYVWLDALANYMTAVGYGSDDAADVASFEKWWPADLHIVGKEIIRFHCVYWPAFLMAAGLELPKKVVAHGWLLFEESKMSKSKGNIVRTETILDGFGEQVYKKQFPESSKSEQDLFAADVLRYFLLREIPFGQDGSFSFEAMITRYNADLANGYGNLVSRTLKLVQTELASQFNSVHRMSFGGLGTTLDYTTAAGTPAWTLAFNDHPGFLAENTPTLEQVFAAALGSRQFSQALEIISSAIKQVDGFISAAEPWKIAKNLSPTATTQLNAILYTAAESIRIITALLYPILPFATASVWCQLGLGNIEVAAENGELQNLEWGGLKPGTKLGPLSPIFPRADKGLAQMMSEMEQDKNTPVGHANAQHDASPEPRSEFVETSLASESFDAAPVSQDPAHPAAGPRTTTLVEANPGGLVAGSAATTTERVGTPPHQEAAASGPFANQAAATPITAGPTDASPQIAIDDFAKVELRVAKVVIAERIPKADKLLRLEVDLGYERRQILSGIAEWYAPEELIGRRIVVITNLAPRKMRGLESHGMLLAASAAEGGKPALATFAESDELPLGSRLR